MADMVWDDRGARYFENGVSHGILFDMYGVGVPWNGLVNVSIDPSGGELESYYYDGRKYMDRILAEDFQATIQAVNTPKEFNACEGVREIAYGLRTHFNKRSKFNLVWKTIIGNDLDSELAYKWHIAYNCTVQPATRTYATLGESSTPDVRSFVITTTPACGRHSYYTFDSRDGDLVALENRLLIGDLPKCYELKGLVASPDEICEVVIETYEEYVYGEIVDIEQKPVSGFRFNVSVKGQINNGLDITELPAVGAFAANDSAASLVGTGEILADDDDVTYVVSDEGDLGYTVGLPPLVGYVEGATFELRIRASISGGVNPDDPDNLDADAQVHISTDADGDLTIGGFSDGTDEGMGFTLTNVDGVPVDYVVPLDLSAWVNVTLSDVVDAFKNGAYINVLGAGNNNPDSVPEFRVYEASVVMLDGTDGSKHLRAISPYADQGLCKTNIFTNVQYSDATLFVDFKFKSMPLRGGFVAPDFDSNFDFLSWRDAPQLGRLVANVDFGQLALTWYVNNVILSGASVDLNVWYTLSVRWALDEMTIKINRVDTPEDFIFDVSQNTGTVTIISVTQLIGGWLGSFGTQYEMALDNIRMKSLCSNFISG